MSEEYCRGYYQDELTEYEYAGVLASGARIQACRTWGIARITWPDGAWIEIALNPTDYDAIVKGADPEADAWEDGCGNLVCRDNAKVD